MAYDRLADSAKAVKLPCANGKAAAAALAAQGICVSTPRLLLRLHVFLALPIHLPPVLHAVRSAGECLLFWVDHLTKKMYFLYVFNRFVVFRKHPFGIWIVEFRILKFGILEFRKSNSRTLMMSAPKISKTARATVLLSQSTVLSLLNSHISANDSATQPVDLYSCIRTASE